jgi:hypothetical protein
MTDFLTRLVASLTDTPRTTGPVQDPDVDRAISSIENLLRQAPMRHQEREHLLAEFGKLLPSLREHHARDLVATALALSGADLRIPDVADAHIALPSSYGLDDAFLTLLGLNAAVSEPWTLIGGLMVLVHCLENEAPFSRPTDDADIAVSVFTHRRALTRVTEQLREASFIDDTPRALCGEKQLSYRWVRDAVKIDVAVPPKTNQQPDAATTVTGLNAVELVATQQALRRTERVPVTVGDQRGYLRRPDLLGAIVIKSSAAVGDRRDPRRHREDLVTLADILAFSGRQVEFAPQMRSKDRHRIRDGAAVVTAREWRAARDPDAAQAAIGFLLSETGDLAT